MMANSPSYPRICVALGFENAQRLLAVAREEANDGSLFLEFRIDHLKDPSKGPGVISSFLGDYPECHVLATCRRKEDGGQFAGDVAGQLRILEASVAAGARSVDVDIQSAEKAKASVRRIRENAELIVSYHNFKATPALEPLLRRLLRIPADVYKIAGTANKPTDNFRLLSLLRPRRHAPLIIQAMGEVGLPTRVLSPSAGGLFSYAASSGGAGTAPGQLTAHDMRHLYRVEKLAKIAKVYGVIADPVSHSVSPAVHNRAFQSRRIDNVYLPFRVEPKRLKDFFEFAAKLPVAGFSVTIPHKEKVIRHLDIVEPLARRIGAVNTVWRKAGKWRGTNTDVDGIVTPLRKHLRLAKASVLIVGSGGAARAAAFALADQGAGVTVTGRDEDRRQILRLARASGTESLARDEIGSRHFDALVHTTPLGMHPDVKSCFFQNTIPADVVLDLVYNPVETELLRRAKQQKRVVIPGTRTFLEQAARQFEIWTGSSAPRAAMERAMAEALAHS